MASPTSQLLLMTLLAVTISGCHGYKPVIHPSKPELILNEGEKLEISCSSESEFSISYPQTVNESEIITSVHEITREDSDGDQKYVFTRNKTVFGDTGYYGCFDADANVTRKDYDDPHASWLYVYVRSNDSAFVQGSGEPVTGIIGQSMLIPCRPTDPELHVNLLMNGEEVPNASFDSKKGFTLTNFTFELSGFLICTIDQNNLSGELFYTVSIFNQETMKEPKIIEENLEYVTAGSRLSVKCVIEIGIEHHYNFYWITPRESDTATIVDPVRVLISSNTFLVTSELIEDNVTLADEGFYTCKVRTFTDEKEAQYYIKVHDASASFLNLTSHDPFRRYKVDEFEPVTFSASVKGYPTPTLTWTGPHGKDIIPDKNIIIEEKNSISTLKINSVRIENSGIYILEANNGRKTENITFELEVFAPPLVLMQNVKNRYNLNESSTFFCNIKSNPKSNISWSYTKCPFLTPETECQNELLTNYSQYSESNITVLTNVSTIIDKSGKIECTACNKLGCDSSEQNIFVTDVPEIYFGIPNITKKVTVGDNITVMCAASLYNFSNVEWVDKNDTPLQISEKIQIISMKTNFTLRSYLTIKDLEKTDEIVYYCKAYNLDADYYEKVSYSISLEEPVKPELAYSNMDGSESIISAREAHNTIFLHCKVAGMPKPQIIWLKNNEPLEINHKQFLLKSDNQTLIINYLMERDSGKYSCFAKNRFGELSRYKSYIVKGNAISKILMATIVVLLIILVILLTYFCIKIRREKMIRKELLDAGLMHFEEGALDCINPDLTVDDQAELLPYDRKWEFPRENLRLGKQLGSGAFGVVMKAEARGIKPDESSTTVAVKMVRRNAEPAYIRALASELKIMVHLGKHLNVVNLLGACTNNIAKRELLVIVEYCHYGNLHNYLLRHRENFINQIDPCTGQIDPSIGREILMRSTSIESDNSLSAASGSTSPGTETIVYSPNTQDLAGFSDETCINSHGSQPGWRSNYRGDYKDKNLKPICTHDLLSWAFQVARGMEYLCQRKVLHGDLAARNILLAENNIVKICDFGLAKTMYKDNNYKKKSDDPMPVKWMAIESIRDRVFSTQSDIWSFGIVLWEFFTLAETPYPSIQPENLYLKLIEGYRMEKPQYATEDIYDIMVQCWRARPVLRPSFNELVYDIGQLLEEGVKMHYVDLNAPYLDLNTANQEGKNDYLTMMSSPDHMTLVSPHDYVNNPRKPSDSAYLSMNSGSPHDDPNIFSPRPSSTQSNMRFEFPSSPTTNGAHSDSEDTPMLRKVKEETELDDDNYLKPIDVHKKREEFVKQREIEKKKEKEQSTKSLTSDRDSGYCNFPKAIELVDIKVEDGREKNKIWDSVDAAYKSPVITRVQDNYVNIPKQKNDTYKDVPDSFMNPSYVYVESSKSDKQVL